jgi:diguanylate cyclase
MMLWDIDDFKIINDTYGHRAGDRVLKTVASCFVSRMRAQDFVARIGGEEFVVLMTGITAELALRIANELRAAVAALRFHFLGTPVRVTVSCGLTEFRDGDATSAVFDRADAALYRAKREGKNLCMAA